MEYIPITIVDKFKLEKYNNRVSLFVENLIRFFRAIGMFWNRFAIIQFKFYFRLSYCECTCMHLQYDDEQLGM